MAQLQIILVQLETDMDCLKWTYVPKYCCFHKIERSAGYTLQGMFKESISGYKIWRQIIYTPPQMVTAPLWYFKCFRFWSHLYFEYPEKLPSILLEPPFPNVNFHNYLNLPSPLGMDVLCTQSLTQTLNIWFLWSPSRVLKRHKCIVGKEGIISSKIYLAMSLGSHCPSLTCK